MILAENLKENDKILMLDENNEQKTVEIVGSVDVPEMDALYFVAYVLNDAGKRVFVTSGFFKKGHELVEATA